MNQTLGLLLSALVIVASSCRPDALQDFPALYGSNDTVVRAYDLAIETVKNNIDDDGIIKAGGEYGGEWTRDISINTWNACNLLFPEESVKSLWSVTEDEGQRIGHQYWDKILWVRAAWEQYLVTGDRDRLEKARICSSNTMKELEDSVFDAEYGLFRGPSVFNDGISGYEIPIPDDGPVRSNVLKNGNTSRIRCLSTNCAYYMAYVSLAAMSVSLGDDAAAASFIRKAELLRTGIRNHFYCADDSALLYCIDQNGTPHHFQEALGYSFAILSGILTPGEASAVVGNAHLGKYGIPSIWPDFKRFSKERPGRHNNLVWPFVNAFFAEASLIAGNRDEFLFELCNLADLAVNKSDGHFMEIYNPETGLADGGWQIGSQWTSRTDQTWSATGYLRMVLNGLFGISFDEDGMHVNPDSVLLAGAGIESLSGIRYRRTVVNISVKPADRRRHGLYVNGRGVGDAVVPSGASGTFDIVLFRD